MNKLENYKKEIIKYLGSYPSVYLGHACFKVYESGLHFEQKDEDLLQAMVNKLDEYYHKIKRAKSISSLQKYDKALRKDTVNFLERFFPELIVNYNLDQLPVYDNTTLSKLL